MDVPIAYVQLLPVELWLACWTTCSHRQLRRVSTVCRFFRSLVWPLLFQHQTIDVAALQEGVNRLNWMDRVRHMHRTAVRLDRLSEADYAPLVRTWKVAFNPPITSNHNLHRVIENIHLLDAMNDRVILTFYTTLGLYQRLSSLHLRHVTIDAAFRTTLVSLPKLENIQLHSCWIMAAIGFLRLKAFTMTTQSDTMDSEPLQVASPETVQILDAGSSISRLINGFGIRKLEYLAQLSLSIVQDVDALFRFLKQCPQLESLVVESLHLHSGSELPSIHSNTVPNLRALTAPSNLHQLLVPNRPVRTAKVLENKDGTPDEDHLLHVCADIGRSSVVLHSLALPRTTATLEFLVSLMSLFPELKELSMEVWGLVRRTYDTPSYRCFRRSWVDSIDRRLPDLRDEAAFDDPPSDDISDNEEEHPPTIIVMKPAFTPELGGLSALSQSIIQNIFEWICNGLLALPAGIEVFRLNMHGCEAELSVGQQRLFIAALSQLYPLVREVQSRGASTNWKRTGNLWKSPADTLWLRVSSDSAFVDDFFIL
ncbi:hypothetical protein B0H19DRAFT_1185410 [Mycena capillaripes]|nr:hypothetical protein B0H19DRAFT_1185410 [Mycena capillaripes]